VLVCACALAATAGEGGKRGGKKKKVEARLRGGGAQLCFRWLARRSGRWGGGEEEKRRGREEERKKLHADLGLLDPFAGMRSRGGEKKKKRSIERAYLASRALFRHAEKKKKNVEPASCWRLDAAIVGMRSRSIDMVVTGAREKKKKKK